MQRVLVAVLAAFLVSIAIPAAPARAASDAKVVVVVGPVGSFNSHYKSDADAIVAEAKRYTSNVVKITTPNATWSRVKTAMQGASVFVYLGHGNGWPSIYAPFQTQTKNGLGLDPSSGADGNKTVYYGEDYLRANVRFAPNAVVLLYHLCYASGNTEPGLAEGTFTQARERVDNYGAGFIGAGARAVLAEGHPSHPNVNYIRQLFTTNRSIDTIFRAAPTWHGHLRGPYASQRTPGLQYQLDPDTTRPSGFYRSVIGDLSLVASKVTGVRPVATGTHPSDFVVPGAAEVVDAAGVPLFATPEAPLDPAAAAEVVLPVATRLRVTEEAAPAPDGTRVLAVTVLGASTKGFVRAAGVAPRDSAGVELWSFDASGAWLSPNADRVNDELVLAPRLSEPATVSFVVKNAAGTTMRSATLTGDLVRFAWNLRDTAGTVAPDGAYTWTARARDAWGNPTTTRTGTFTVDATAPVTKATASSTLGSNGWSVSPVNVTLTATDALSGVRTRYWRVDGGEDRTYADVATVKADGVRTFQYRSIDKAGIRESWRTLTLRIDATGPVIKVASAGEGGTTPGAWRGPVTLTPTITDATSGVAAKSVSVDGATATALSSASIVVDGEGAHTVVFAARDAAGTRTTKTVDFVIDTVAPTIELATRPEGAPNRTVTPNGDGKTDALTIPFTASEPVVVTGVVTSADGGVVRTISAAVPGGEQGLAWDGRTSAGTPAADGTYTITLTPADGAGNPGAPVAQAVDVYGALASVVRTPVSFFPHDGDALAGKTRLAWTLLSPALVTVEVQGPTGDRMPTTFGARELPAGAAAWNWNGTLADGTLAPRGGYRIVVTATNGTQASSQAVSVYMDAFRLIPSVEQAVRGRSFTLTARTHEPLATTPVVVIKEPGLTARSVTMTKATSTTWTVRITPKTTAGTGTLGLTVRARDTAGGTNSSVLKLVLK